MRDGPYPVRALKIPMLTAYAGRSVGDVWILFIVVWFSAALTTKPRRKATGRALRLPVVLILIAAVLLLGRYIDRTWLARPVLPSYAWLVLPGFVFTLAGIALALWARYHLGRNWGQPGTMRVGHELVTSGPYAYIRHPIYVGAGVALIGTAFVIGNLLMALFSVVVILRFWWAARVEDNLLLREFGEKAGRR
jgi:protein-S-isoprenylcysteine O-methyltransferase Ste14